MMEGALSAKDKYAIFDIKGIEAITLTHFMVLYHTRLVFSCD
jgi:hypothetical protein